MHANPSPHDTFYIRCRGIIIHNNKLLVVRHAGQETYTALPGGHMDYGETPIACMQRELLEELGVEATVGKIFFINIFENRPLNRTSLEIMYEITNPEDFADLEKIKEHDRSHAYEIADIKFVGKDEACNLLPGFAWQEFIKGSFDSGSNFDTKYMYNIKENE